ncbi:hypothetical protein [Chengkuizengella axinellae]|uniref:Uncharacterized protein n=1 Tax=Chengkuizengella axinellae TaxID=3064388 RepID=A0ABT9J5Y6_9BACL|nr:hypothetical protein [Chengkuizengella sp. 2205SS18-9]MDP5277021.1 hypothetical protein [Chengkuizengella sp. 2205SS18-9]
MIHEMNHQQSYRQLIKPMPRLKPRTYGGVKFKRRPKLKLEISMKMDHDTHDVPVIAYARRRPNDPGFSVYGYGYPTSIY